MLASERRRGGNPILSISAARLVKCACVPSAACGFDLGFRQRPPTRLDVLVRTFPFREFRVRRVTKERSTILGFGSMHLFGRLYTIEPTGVFPEELPLHMAEEGSFSPDAARASFTCRWRVPVAPGNAIAEG